MSVSNYPFAQHPAVVSREPRSAHDAGEYLVIRGDGSNAWTSDPTTATTFDSMKEAMRAVLHLPGSLHAFGVPFNGGLADRRDLH